MQGVLLEAHRNEKYTCTHKTRVSILVDRTVAIGAVYKGRSGASILDKVCQRLAAVIINGDTQLLSHSVASYHITTDELSCSAIHHHHLPTSSGR